MINKRVGKEVFFKDVNRDTMSGRWSMMRTARGKLCGDRWKEWKGSGVSACAGKLQSQECRCQGCGAIATCLRPIRLIWAFLILPQFWHSYYIPYSANLWIHRPPLLVNLARVRHSKLAFPFLQQDSLATHYPLPSCAEYLRSAGARLSLTSPNVA